MGHSRGITYKCIAIRVSPREGCLRTSLPTWILHFAHVRAANPGKTGCWRNEAGGERRMLRSECERAGRDKGSSGAGRRGRTPRKLHTRLRSTEEWRPPLGNPRLPSPPRPPPRSSDRTNPKLDLTSQQPQTRFSLQRDCHL